MACGFSKVSAELVLSQCHVCDHFAKCLEIMASHCSPQAHKSLKATQEGCSADCGLYPTTKLPWVTNGPSAAVNMSCSSWDRASHPGAKSAPRNAILVVLGGDPGHHQVGVHAQILSD